MSMSHIDLQVYQINYHLTKQDVIITAYFYYGLCIRMYVGMHV